MQRDEFASLTDPRRANARHQLSEILVMAICAVICGAEGWEDIEEYGKAQAEGFEQVLDLPHGSPCDDTFRRVLSRLAPDEWIQCFMSWSEALSDRRGGDIVSIEGKALRRSFAHAASKAAMHMVSAWANANRLGLGPLKVDDKSNAITAIPKLLQLLDLQGATVTIDAMECQQEIAQAIAEQGADYVLARKANQQTLYDDVKLFLDDAKATGCAGMHQACAETVDGDHGRIETRPYWVRSDIEW